MKIVLIRARAIDPAINKIADTLAKNGHDVTLLLWDRQTTSSKFDETRYKIDLFKMPAPYDKMSILLFFPIWWLYEFVYLMRTRPDVIHACDLDTLFPTIVFKIIMKKKLYYSIYDFYANNFPNGSFNGLRLIIRNVVSKIEKIGIGFTDALFIADESRRQEIDGAKINKIEYIYNAPPDSNLGDRILRGNNSDLVIFYAGIISKQRGLQYMVEAVASLEGVKLILAGEVRDPSIIDRASMSPDKIQYVGWLPSYNDIIERTKVADVLFRFSDPSIPKTKFESPNKLFEAMMCGKPIIVSDDSAMANIVRKYNCGYVVAYGDLDELKGVILKMKNDPINREMLGNNGRKAYDSNFSWEIMEKKILAVYSS